MLGWGIYITSKNYKNKIKEYDIGIPHIYQWNRIRSPEMDHMYMFNYFSTKVLRKSNGKIKNIFNKN